MPGPNPRTGSCATSLHSVLRAAHDSHGAPDLEIKRWRFRRWRHCYASRGRERSVCARILARRHAQNALEVAQEVALVGEADAGGGTCRCYTFLQKTSSAFDSQINLKGVGRRADILGELVYEVKLAQPRHYRELMETHRFIEPFPQVGLRAFHSAAAVFRLKRRWLVRGMPSEGPNASSE